MTEPRLKALLALPENKKCADCWALQPRYASVGLGSGEPLRLTDSPSDAPGLTRIQQRANRAGSVGARRAIAFAGGAQRILSHV
jgi:hypothetical protein